MAIEIIPTNGFQLCMLFYVHTRKKNQFARLFILFFIDTIFLYLRINDNTNNWIKRMNNTFINLLEYKYGKMRVI